MALGVVFNGESGLFHGLYYQDVADDGHGSGRSRGRHAQYAYFLGFSGAKAYIGFVCQGAVGVSGDDDELQSRVQVVVKGESGSINYAGDMGVRQHLGGVL